MRFRLVGLALLVSIAAWAHWEPVTVDGVPKDVNILDAGVFAVMAGNEMAVFTCPYDGGICARVRTVTSAPLPIGASMTASGCIWTVDSNSNLSGCGFLGQIPIQNPRQLRCVEPSFCGLTGRNATLNQLFYTVAPASSGTWYTVFGVGSSLIGSPANLSALRVGDAGYLLYVTSPTTLSLGGQPAVQVQLPPPNFGMGGVDGKLFQHPDGGVGLLLALVDSDQMDGGREHYGDYVAIDAATANVGWRNGRLQFDNPIIGLKRFAYAETGGTEFGYGFGMGTNRDGGIDDLTSPVPNPNQPGQLWVPRSVKPDGGSNWGAIACDTTRMCVVATGFADAGNVWVYRNLGAFERITLSAPESITEGDVRNAAFNDAYDSDGDPIWFTWSLDAGGPVSVTTDAGDGLHAVTSASVRALASPNGPCTQQATITANLSDGYSAHDRPISKSITYYRRQTDPFTVTPATQSVLAGSGDVTLTAIPQGQCTGVLTWSLSSDAGALQATPNSPLQAIYTPPTHWCGADGGDVTVTARGQLDGGTPLFSASDIHIVPWGSPFPPRFAGGGTFTQLAGTLAKYGFLDPLHPCQQNPALPALLVLVLDAGTEPSVNIGTGLTDLAVDSSDRCFQGTVQFSLATHLRSDPPALSPATHLEVHFVPDLAPIGPGSNFSMNLSVDAGGSFVSGAFTLDAGCLENRRLSANLSITDDSTKIKLVELPNLTVPGSWQTAVPGSCIARSLTATADLYERDGGQAGPPDVQKFTTVSRPPGIGELRPARLYVTCQGINSTLTVTDPPPEKCPLAATKVLWTQDAGPAVSILGNGATVQIASIEQGLDNLIGQTLLFEISSNTGSGVPAKEKRSVKLWIDPFVELSHSISPVGATSEDVVTVTTSVLSNADCPVSNVRLEVAMTGLIPIEGTHRIDGDDFVSDGGVGLVWDGGTNEAGRRLNLGPFRLEPHQKHSVTWLAKVAQLAKPTIQARATVSDFEISRPSYETEAQPARCGCQTTASFGWVWMALLAVAIRKRRHLKA